MSAAEYVYVASSWRCKMQPAVIAVLKAAGIDHYDFRNPTSSTVFRWSEVGLFSDVGDGRAYERDYLRALDLPRAVEGFGSDFRAMHAADTFVLVLPCGRSAHLELGWAVGAGKRTAILLDGPRVTPELMYKMVDFLAPNMLELLRWLGVDD